MTADPAERFAMFIDGANLHSAAKNLGFELDFHRLLELFRGRGRLLRAYYYTALPEEPEYSPVRPLADWLAYNGFQVVTKPTRRVSDPQTGAVRLKGNMDIEIAVDMLSLASRIDHAVLVSGDGDFRRLVEAVQALGVRVTVVSTTRTQPPFAADELRRQADAFLDLADLAPEIARNRRPSRVDDEPR
jgi:uncharacterized LabA/DUF88 family protein